MDVWDVRQDDEVPDAEDQACSECGDPLVEPEDIEDGMHFLCDPTIEWDDDEEFPPDEGGESG